MGAYGQFPGGPEQDVLRNAELGRKDPLRIRINLRVERVHLGQVGVPRHDFLGQLLGIELPTAGRIDLGQHAHDHRAGIETVHPLALERLRPCHPFRRQFQRQGGR